MPASTSSNSRSVVSVLFYLLLLCLYFVFRVLMYLFGSFIVSPLRRGIYLKIYVKWVRICTQSDTDQCDAEGCCTVYGCSQAYMLHTMLFAW